MLFDYIYENTIVLKGIAFDGHLAGHTGKMHSDLIRQGPIMSIWVALSFDSIVGLQFDTCSNMAACEALPGHLTFIRLPIGSEKLLFRIIWVLYIARCL